MLNTARPSAKRVLCTYILYIGCALLKSLFARVNSYDVLHFQKKHPWCLSAVGVLKMLIRNLPRKKNGSHWEFNPLPLGHDSFRLTAEPISLIINQTLAKKVANDKNLAKNWQKLNFQARRPFCFQSKSEPMMRSMFEKKVLLL